MPPRCFIWNNFSRTAGIHLMFISGRIPAWFGLEGSLMPIQSQQGPPPTRPGYPKPIQPGFIGLEYLPNFPDFPIFCLNLFRQLLVKFIISLGYCRAAFWHVSDSLKTKTRKTRNRTAFNKARDLNKTLITLICQDVVSTHGMSLGFHYWWLESVPWLHGAAWARQGRGDGEGQSWARMSRDCSSLCHLKEWNSLEHL